MPLFGLLLLVEIAFIIHAVKTGRASPWAFIILLAPLVGMIAYIVVVLIPDWMGSRQGRQTQQAIAKTLNPERRYRALAEAVEVSDTIANRAALAEECHRVGGKGRPSLTQDFGGSADKDVCAADLLP